VGRRVEHEVAIPAIGGNVLMRREMVDELTDPEARQATPTRRGKTAQEGVSFGF
jgi:hypothetical protein